MIHHKVGQIKLIHKTLDITCVLRATFSFAKAFIATAGRVRI